MLILAMESTAKAASVALVRDGVLAAQSTQCSGLTHSRTLLPMAEDLMKNAGVKLSEVDRFAVAHGPGSFTGVRIGVCMANALGAAHNKPVIAVDALETLANPYANETVCALIDARNGNGYGALYRKGETLVAPCACVIADFTANLPEPCRMVGTGTNDPKMPSAADVAKLAARREGEREIAPMYLKLSQAERMWNA